MLYREDERDLIPVARQYGVSLIPYSSLAGGHLTHTEWASDSKRSQTDKTVANESVTKTINFKERIVNVKLKDISAWSTEHLPKNWVTERTKTLRKVS